LRCTSHNFSTIPAAPPNISSVDDKNIMNIIQYSSPLHSVERDNGIAVKKTIEITDKPMSIYLADDVTPASVETSLPKKTPADDETPASVETSLSKKRPAVDDKIQHDDDMALVAVNDSFLDESFKKSQDSAAGDKKESSLLISNTQTAAPTNISTVHDKTTMNIILCSSPLRSVEGDDGIAVEIPNSADIGSIKPDKTLYWDKHSCDSILDMYLSFTEFPSSNPSCNTTPVSIPTNCCTSPFTPP
jgi:hypothetical protein